MTGSDELIFQDENDNSDNNQSDNKIKDSWNLLVVDDEPEVHQVTKLALRNFTFQDTPLDIKSAYSASEAKQVMSENSFAVVLLDVVMETDHAGLELARWVREDLKDHHVRIILRTGQPGQAPERDVITDYDINDYKEKTELTSNKLYTLMCSSLRSYRDIIALHRNKLGLEGIITGTGKIFAQHSLRELTQGALDQLTALLKVSEGAFYGELEGIAATLSGDENQILAATGKFSDFVSEHIEDAVKNITRQKLLEHLQQHGNYFADGYFIGVYRSHLKRKNILYLEGLPKLSELDRHLLQIFCNHIGIAFDNISMFEEVEITQREIVYRLSEAVESRSKETSFHVKRMAEICHLLAKKSGFDERDLEIIRMAAPLHDIGKIAIPDSILNKPGKLVDDEWEIMKTHAQLGHDILADSKLEVLQIGAKIAGEHHEKWDGSGYPNGKKGEEISIHARIAAIADVFDALYNRRCYKEPWPLSKIIDFIQSESDKHFDPELSHILIHNMAEIVAIQNQYPD
ncbi:DUF3369 domain-containing protein [Aliikangiella coralliicola]|uniref:DUF3369 domain-containing protein n=1 Tax=Aliikangiella coralliicola TaxID=2592383 RepID=A0A545U8H8_9GAMM|nr:DUF3369 domain-containing protein [Aliikangiella coralliicola]TQV85776.1 DUF3369 domain-containing protein [Aliikangiella coralliicola]